MSDNFKTQFVSDATYSKDIINNAERVISDHEHTIIALQTDLAAERARADTLAQALEKARAAMKFYIATAFSMSTDEAEHSNISAMQDIDAALLEYRTARGAQETLAERD